MSDTEHYKVWADWEDEAEDAVGVETYGTAEEAAEEWAQARIDSGESPDDFEGGSTIGAMVRHVETGALYRVVIGCEYDPRAYAVDYVVVKEAQDV